MATGSTTNYLFPYPQQTDPVDVATDVQALADSIDTKLKEIIEDTSAALFTSASVSNGISLPIYDDANEKMILSLSQDLQITGKPTFAGLVVTASSSTDLLSIVQTGAGNAFIVHDSASVDSTPFVINADGNVGIGNSSPDVKLAISSTSGVQAKATDGTVTQIIAQPDSSIAFSGTSSNHDYALITNNVEKVRIASNGNVGIGVTSPSYNLHVSGTGYFSDKLSLMIPSPTNAPLNIPHGTAPLSPINGDMWTTSFGLYLQVNGYTIGPLGVGGAEFSDIFLLAGM